jgi:DNA-directed RNA polymerase subunit RPC12/RpoP
MKTLITLLLLLAATSQTYAALENTTCKSCHPVIFEEYQNSIHSKASIYKDVVHKAVWDKHPAKAKGSYKCAKCHTPSDHDVMSGKSKLTDNEIQRTEPISCQQCHKIESVEKHTKVNKNILTSKKKYFFSADKEKKGTKVVFKEESSFFGMVTKKSGSPYHDIDYSNEGYYNGDSCMGCHSHKQNSKNFAVCDLEVKQGDSKESCVSCHLPQVKGSLANQKGSATHAFHGQSIHNSTPVLLSKYIKLSLDKNTNGFNVSIKNEAIHTLFPQPLRLNQLRVSIERDGKTIDLKTESFARVIGTDGKPSMPWLADAIISDTSIKAHETRVVKYGDTLQKGDTVVVKFGYYVVNPKAAKKLEITDKSVTKFIVLTKKKFEF